MPDQCNAPCGVGPLIPVTLPEPIGNRSRIFTYLSVAICLLAAAYIFERVRFWADHLHMMGSIPAEPIQIAIGPTGFVVPPDYVISQRRNLLEQPSSSNYVRLAMTWPGLGPHTSGSSLLGDEMIRIELEHNPGRESLRARLDPFYRRLARGGELSGPGGLKLLNLSRLGGKRSDMIVYDPSKQNGFIARCRQQSSTSKATCHRAVQFSSGLDLRYSFDRSLLSDWRRLDRAVLLKIDSFKAR